LTVAKWDMIHTNKEVVVGIIYEFRRLWPKLSWDAQCVANKSQSDMAHYLLHHQDAFVEGRGMHDTKLWQQGDWRCVPAAVLIKNLSFNPPCSLVHYLPASDAWSPCLIADLVVILGIITQQSMVRDQPVPQLTDFVTTEQINLDPVYTDTWWNKDATVDLRSDGNWITENRYSAMSVAERSGHSANLINAHFIPRATQQQKEGLGSLTYNGECYSNPKATDGFRLYKPAPRTQP